MPFLTEIDKNAAIKGSRDPLGIQSIWVGFGRNIVGNLTTVTNSVRGFTTLLLGYYFIERAYQLGYKDSALDIFLKWEQLVAYARYIVSNHKDTNIRGIERVESNVGEGRVILSVKSGQILSNQKTYGIWGLFSVAAYNSGLIKLDPHSLKESARQFIQEVYLPIFHEYALKDGDRILSRMLEREEVKLDIENKDLNILRSINKIMGTIKSKKEQQFYKEALLYGGPQDTTAGQQKVLSEILYDHKNNDGILTPSFVLQLSERAIHKGSEMLSKNLIKIHCCESVMAISAMLFDYLILCHGEKIADLSILLNKNFGKSIKYIDLLKFKGLDAEIRAFSSEQSSMDNWYKLASGFNAGDYKSVIRVLIKINQDVMKVRGNGSWLEEKDGRLKVNYRDQGGALLSIDMLKEYWRYSYFLDSLGSLTMEVG